MKGYILEMKMKSAGMEFPALKRHWSSFFLISDFI